MCALPHDAPENIVRHPVERAGHESNERQNGRHIDPRWQPEEIPCIEQNVPEGKYEIAGDMLRTNWYGNRRRYRDQIYPGTCGLSPEPRHDQRYEQKRSEEYV